MTNNSSYCRQGVAEQVWIEEDGSIRQAEATSCGLNGGPLAGIGKYPAYIACVLMDKNDNRAADGKKIMAPCITQEGEDRECGPEQFVYNIINKCVVGYKYFDFRNTSGIALVLRGNARGRLMVRYEENGEDKACMEILLQGGEWSRIEGKLPSGSEKSGLYLEFLGEGSIDLLEIAFF